MKIHSLLLLFAFFFKGIVLGHQVEPEKEITKVLSKKISVSKFLSWNSFPLSSESTHSTKVTDHTTTPIQSIVDNKRELNTDCMTFAFSHDNSDGYYQDDYVEVGGSTTLDSYCNTNNCCHQNGYYGFLQEYYDDQACGFWSINPNVHYTVCPDSCVGPSACKSVAQNAGSGSSITFQSGSCSDTSAWGYSCNGMAQLTTKTVNISIGSDSCTNVYSCAYMAFGASNLEKLSIGSDSCTTWTSCDHAAVFAHSLKQLIVHQNQCDSNGICSKCGRDSTFDDTLQLTEECCAAISGETYGTYFDEACNYTPPPEEPNPCKNVSCSNRGKCKVLSLTEAECQCENTFIQSENKLDCICPSNHEFHANVNRCLPPPTAAPTNSPTKSPTLAPTASPTESPIIKTEECIDDDTATFKLIKFDKDVPCSWITKNWKRLDVRKERYCGRDDVKTICPASCGLCPE